VLDRTRSPDNRVTAELPPVPGPLRPAPERLRLATVPPSGPYVDAVLPRDVVRVGHLGEPSPWLDAAHLAEFASELDVLHLHTGSAPVTDAAVECWSETVRRCGIPLVVTVHAVRRPGAHGSVHTHAAEDAHLEAVLTTAEVVLTLTDGAADAIAERFGRTAIVVAHPSVVRPDPELGAERGLVGLRLRAGDHEVCDQVTLVRAALSGAVSGGGRLRVLASTQADVAPAVRELARQQELELVLHDEAGWAAQLQQLHVAVLPEPCGTHSRDLEICRDVGTRVVAPSCGWAAGQWSEVVSYGEDDRGELDSVSLNAAVAAALTRAMPRPADRDWREEQLAAVRQVHAEVYTQVAADRSWV
jgi:hypothetical protein